MKKAPYEKITISQIAERAGVPRMTYYRNYKTKEDVLKNYSEYLTEELAHMFRESKHLDMLLETTFQLIDPSVLEKAIRKYICLFTKKVGQTFHLLAGGAALVELEQLLRLLAVIPGAIRLSTARLLYPIRPRCRFQRLASLLKILALIVLTTGQELWYNDDRQTKGGPKCDFTLQRTHRLTERKSM